MVLEFHASWSELESSRVFVERRGEGESGQSQVTCISFFSSASALFAPFLLCCNPKMQSDDVIWSVINQQFCSYKVKWVAALQSEFPALIAVYQNRNSKLLSERIQCHRPV